MNARTGRWYLAYAVSVTCGYAVWVYLCLSFLAGGPGPRRNHHDLIRATARTHADEATL